MGTKQSKIEGDYLPETPPPKKLNEINMTADEYYDDNPDPRSPNIYRTPLNKLVGDERYCTAKNFNEISGEPITPFQLKKSESLKKKLLKGLKCTNIFDPRSPSTFINRTPIVFNENIEDNNPADKSLNLNDTFSDLFIGNTLNLSDKENIISKESTRIEEAVKDDLKENQLDPRSPTVGVDRTPMIFNDDIPDENLMLESVLEKIKLNESQKPQNKQLERIKNPPRRKTRSSARIAASNATNKMSIYKDRDVQVSSTPKKLITENVNENKRTPLGCVVNKTQLRSKSSENFNKNNKICPSINSFDDYNLKNLQKDNCENNSSMNNFIARVN